MIGQPQPAPEPAPDVRPAQDRSVSPAASPVLPREIGGRDGPEPTRYGDWEKNGRCIDF
nr:DUF1674 domain-containing protein [Chiayiivirga flava]